MPTPHDRAMKERHHKEHMDKMNSSTKIALAAIAISLISLGMAIVSFLK
jgi:hypothetical protein